MNLKVIFNKYGSTILTGLGVAGVLGTAFMARHDALSEVHSIVHGKIPETSEEKVIFYAKRYWKTAVLGAATITSIVLAERLDAKKIGALTAAAVIAEEKLKKYRGEIEKRFGKEIEQDIYIESCEKEWHMYPELPNNEDSGELLYFYDDFSERYFRATAERVQQAIYHLNRNFHLKGYAYLSEFYEFLGLKANDLSKTIGWSDIYYLEECGLTPWIDFFSYELMGDNGVKFTVICFDVEPTVSAMRDFT